MWHPPAPHEVPATEKDMGEVLRDREERPESMIELVSPEDLSGLRL